MTFCHECGKVVTPPFAKFCRSCGASQWEEAPLPITPANLPFTESPAEPLPIPGNTPPLPQSRYSHPPSQVPLEPAIPKLCRTCSSPLHADEKFCGICGSPIRENDHTLQPVAEIPSSTPPQVCTSCGSPLFEAGKFCGICGASSDSIVKPPLQPPVPKINVPTAQLQPPPAIIKVCQSCGSPLSGTELFCGICGILLQFTSPGLPACQQHDGKTCSNCGKPIRATTRFCGACGMAVGSK